MSKARVTLTARGNGTTIIRAETAHVTIVTCAPNEDVVTEKSRLVSQIARIEARYTGKCEREQ